MAADNAAAATNVNGGQTRTIMPSTEEITELSSTDAPREGGRCHLCDGRIRILVSVQPQANGQSVTYYACEQCGHVLVWKR